MPYGTINADLMTTSDGVSSSGLYGFKNRIINGAMVIDQRNAGASASTGASANTYTLDRWDAYASASGKYTVQRSTVAPAGFTNSLLVTSASAYSVTSTDIFAICQFIEGFNIADFGWGAVGASTVTISFWVRSSLTGTFGGCVNNAGFNYSYPFTYTINAANTWEQKTVTIPGPTAGTWATDNTAGLRLWIGLGVGTTYSGTAGSWSAVQYEGATGATSVVGTNGATFYITGVQLEKGSTATSFDYRPYSAELAMCQRYAIVYGRDQIYNEIGGTGFAFSTTQVDIPINVPVAMRTTPSVTLSGSVQVSDGASATAVSSITLQTNQSSTLIPSIRAVVASGLTAFRPYRLETANSTSAYCLFSAEL